MQTSTVLDGLIYSYHSYGNYAEAIIKELELIKKQNQSYNEIIRQFKLYISNNIDLIKAKYFFDGIEVSRYSAQYRKLNDFLDKEINFKNDNSLSLNEFIKSVSQNIYSSVKKIFTYIYNNPGKTLVFLLGVNTAAKTLAKPIFTHKIDNKDDRNFAENKSSYHLLKPILETEINKINTCPPTGSIYDEIAPNQMQIAPPQGWEVTEDTTNHQSHYMFRVAAWGNHASVKDSLRCHYYDREGNHIKLQSIEKLSSEQFEVHPEWHDGRSYYLCTSHQNDVDDCPYDAKMNNK